MHAVGGDLSLISVIIGVVTCPSQFGEAFCCLHFWAMGVLSFQVKVWFEEGFDVKEKYERARIKLASDYSAHGQPHPTTRETPTPILRMLARMSCPRWRSC